MWDAADEGDAGRISSLALQDVPLDFMNKVRRSTLVLRSSVPRRREGRAQVVAETFCGRRKRQICLPTKRRPHPSETLSSGPYAAAGGPGANSPGGPQGPRPLHSRAARCGSGCGIERQGEWDHRSQALLISPARVASPRVLRSAKVATHRSCCCGCRLARLPGRLSGAGGLNPAPLLIAPCPLPACCCSAPMRSTTARTGSSRVRYITCALPHRSVERSCMRLHEVSAPPVAHLSLSLLVNPPLQKAPPPSTGPVSSATTTPRRCSSTEGPIRTP